MVDTLVRNEPQNVRMSIITVDIYFDNKGVIAGFFSITANHLFYH